MWVLEMRATVAQEGQVVDILELFSTSQYIDTPVTFAGDFRHLL